MLAAALLAGCALPPTREADLPARATRTQIAAFSFDGRVALRQGETRHNAHIAWHHTDDADVILFTTPLGQGVAELSRDRSGARLIAADREMVAAPDWEELSTRLFGFALPLSELPRWLLADVAAAARDAAGRPTTALAGGWEIRYLDYESSAPGALPLLMEFRRDDIEVRLKVDSWQMD